MSLLIFQETKSFSGLFTLARKDDDFLRIEWDGINELEEYFDKFEKDFERILLEEYTKYGMLVEEGTKALVHHDEGDLEDSISFDKAKRVGNTVIVEGGSNSVYALRRHEEPYRYGVHDKYDNGSKFSNYYVYGRGRGTLGKPQWRGYKPGRKFLQNAINATNPDYDKMNERILERALDGDKK
ncbi:hypothetical protein [Metabacillus litoralis]|uniref:hypothetical protein n=1 Tax=Metabacillus litoralis TaxID=152268 RepID=UPI00203BAEFE|nr:hypothetical protein [Metabacillus litoralis]MCM3651329.1 hypothetical protein [Metabacillus litoralis]